MRFNAVIGLGFGDEGKGSVVDWLASKWNDPLVIRYCGGQQAGHTVVKDGMRHVFSNFGSGTLRSVPTYWSKYCTVDPVAMWNECRVLNDLKITPLIHHDRDCMITTPWDKRHNLSFGMRNGSCGVGVGQVIERNKSHRHFTMSDLQFKSVINIKLDLIENWYGSYLNRQLDNDGKRKFRESLEFLAEDTGHFFDFNEEHIIFEVAQGLLLDQHYGFFPYVTRGNTGMKNILKIVDDKFHTFGKPDIDLYLVTRAYQTRHGIGPMTYEGEKDGINIPEYETNKCNDRQGPLRYSILDLDLIQYAMDCDPYIRESKNKNLVMTCCDQLSRYRCIKLGRICEYNSLDNFLNTVNIFLKPDRFFINTSPESKNMQRFDE